MSNGERTDSAKELLGKLQALEADFDRWRIGEPYPQSAAELIREALRAAYQEGQRAGEETARVLRHLTAAAEDQMRWAEKRLAESESRERKAVEEATRLREAAFAVYALMDTMTDAGIPWSPRAADAFAELWDALFAAPPAAPEQATPEPKG